jgi:ribonuclease HI
MVLDNLNPYRCGLLKAVNWIRDLHLNNVIFELDSKNVVNNFNNNNIDDFEFGDIIKECKRVFFSCLTNS